MCQKLKGILDMCRRFNCPNHLSQQTVSIYLLKMRRPSCMEVRCPREGGKSQDLIPNLPNHKTIFFLLYHRVYNALMSWMNSLLPSCQASFLQLAKLIIVSVSRLAVVAQSGGALGNREDTGLWGTACPECPFHPSTPSTEPCKNNCIYLSSNWYTRHYRRGFTCSLSNPCSNSISRNLIFISQMTLGKVNDMSKQNRQSG